MNHTHSTNQTTKQPTKQTINEPYAQLPTKQTDARSHSGGSNNDSDDSDDIDDSDDSDDSNKASLPTGKLHISDGGGGGLRNVYGTYFNTT